MQCPRASYDAKSKGMCGALRRCVELTGTYVRTGAVLIRIYVPLQILSALHQRFPIKFTLALVTILGGALAPPNKASLATMAPEQREKEEAGRLTRQRPVLRVCAELALVGVIRDAPGRSGGEWIMKALRDLVLFFSRWKRIYSS